jgi:hypothetical protein
MTLRITFTLRSKGGEGDARLLVRTWFILQLPERLQLRLQRLKLAGSRWQRAARAGLRPGLRPGPDLAMP